MGRGLGPRLSPLLIQTTLTTALSLLFLPISFCFLPTLFPLSTCVVICNEDSPCSLLLGSQYHVTVTRDQASHDVCPKLTQIAYLVAVMNSHLSSEPRSDVGRNRCGRVALVEAVAAIRMTGNVIVVVRRLMAANCGTSFRGRTKCRNCRLRARRVSTPNRAESAPSCTPHWRELASQSEQSLRTT